MANVGGVIWQSNILVLIVNTFCFCTIPSGAIAIAVIVDYEGTFDIDLDRARSRRHASIFETSSCSLGVCRTISDLKLRSASL